MSKHSSFRLALVPMAAALTAMIALPLLGADPSPETAQLGTYAHADGSNYFALSLKAQLAETAEAPDVLILFDTSASQAGEIRTDALVSTAALVDALGQDAQVRLMAVDVNAVPMSDGFVSPAGDAMAKAFDKLDKRVPLGATDMKKALQAAVAAFDAGSTRPKAVVYIGDGISKAGFLGTDDFEAAVADLVGKRIPVSVHAIGPQVDLPTLNALAAQTGGQVFGDWEQETAERIGTDLAAAAKATVVWPEQDQVAFPGGFEVYPMRMPPLRSDRDTVLIGKYAADQKGPFDIEVTVATAEGPKQIAWSIDPEESNEDNNYLAALAAGAQLDGGLTLPIVSSQSLPAVRQAINSTGQSISQLAAQQLGAGDLDAAEAMARTALKGDPGNPEALTVLRAVVKQRGGDTSAEPDALDLVGDASNVPSDPLAGAGGFADMVGAMNAAIQQKIESDTRQVIDQSRRNLEREPEVAIQNLKFQLDNVATTADLDPDRRDQLLDMLSAAIRQAQQRKTVIEKRSQEQQEKIAIVREQIIVMTELAQREEKIKQLMRRYNSLVEEGRYELAEDAAAMEVQVLDPDNVPGIAATLTARTTGYLANAMVLRVKRQKKLVDALYQVELAHVPFPDEPPILYPPAEVWAELSARRKDRYSSMDLASRSDAERNIRKALDDPTTIDFLEQPLSDVIDYWKDLHQIEIQIDTKALDDVNMGTDEPVSKQLDGTSLRSALRLVLGDLDLTYVIRDEVLMITTPEEAETQLTTKVYPVADLVIPVSPMMGGGMMGGMGGGMMGGMGGGMGGGMMGGMGGMGGGMGGMGGGMGGMGGGFMNVPANHPRNRLDPRRAMDPRNKFMPNVPAFQAFAVKDDLSLTPSTVSSGKPQPSPADAVDLTVPEGADPADHWNTYFDENQPSEDAVRDASQALMRAKKFDSAVSFIETALRKCNPQIWMYEGLALAMQAAGRPKQDIERAALSAADFCGSPAELLFLAVYMERLGIEHRALAIYQQVAQLVPTSPEPYIHGLKLAKRLEDEAGIQWATVGILSQAWEMERKDVWVDGYLSARAMLKKLQDEKRLDEAKAYQAALDEAVIRDCVVKVSWTGNADIDLLVEEPSGTICSHRTRRTTGGGLMGSDSFSTLGDVGNPVSAEVYSCPKGFSGNYRMLVRRVWGEITAGKVIVEIHTNYGAKNQRTLSRTIDLGDKESMVVFNLDEGRRTESLTEQQVANAAADQLALNTQIVAQNHGILAQQIAGQADRGSLSDFYQSGGGGGQVGQRPFFVMPRSGAVGYQPQITNYPEGAMLNATAVISADRRYVRVTPSPSFSGIAEVNVFNSSTGANTQGRGGTGGQGFGGMGGGMGGQGGFSGGMGGGMSGGMGGMSGGMGGMSGGMGMM